MTEWCSQPQFWGRISKRTYEHKKKKNAVKITRMFCVWKINHLCWEITPSTCEEISRCCENRRAQTQTSRDLLGVSTAEPQGRQSCEKFWMQVSVNSWKQTSQEMYCFMGKGKQKHFCPLMLTAFLNKHCHFLSLFIALLSFSRNCSYCSFSYPQRQCDCSQLATEGLPWAGIRHSLERLSTWGKVLPSLRGKRNADSGTRALIELTRWKCGDKRKSKEDLSLLDVSLHWLVYKFQWRIAL